MMTLRHATTSANLDSILTDGLLVSRIAEIPWGSV